MTHRIQRPRIVERDLAGLADHIAKDNLDAARRFLMAAEAAMQMLAEMPHLGGEWESTNPRLAGLRAWPIRGFENYLILYRPIRDGISVVRMLHGAQDIESVLTKGP